jgi:hypothetical protein
MPEASSPQSAPPSPRRASRPRARQGASVLVAILAVVITLGSRGAADLQSPIQLDADAPNGAARVASEGRWQHHPQAPNPGEYRVADVPQAGVIEAPSFPQPDPTPAVSGTDTGANGPAVPATTPGATSAPTPTPGTGSTVSVDPRVGNDFILVSRARLVGLPMSGPAWNQLKAVADADPGMPNLADNSQDNNVRVLAQALVFARTGDGTYRARVVTQLKAAVGTEGVDTLALGREAAAYALAADFIGLSDADPQFDQATFRPWLRSLLAIQLDGRSLRSTHEERANNWGTHAGASRAAIAAYLGDAAELARTAQVFRGWLGERSAYAGFTYNEDNSWQSNPKAPVGINPVGAAIDGVNVDGALPEEMRRGSSFRWPPAQTGYPWGALEGAVLQAEILQRYGYDTFSWGDRALLRATQFLFERAGWRPEGNDQWVFWVVDYRYGTGYRVSAPVPFGKNFGFSDWLYGP